MNRFTNLQTKNTKFNTIHKPTLNKFLQPIPEEVIIKETIEIPIIAQIQEIQEVQEIETPEPIIVDIPDIPEIQQLMSKENYNIYKSIRRKKIKPI